MEDIEIARNAKLKKIVDVAKNIGIDEEDLEQYGKYKAKISGECYKKLKDNKDGKLILVTAINPTPLRRRKNYNINRTCRWISTELAKNLFWH